MHAAESAQKGVAYLSFLGPEGLAPIMGVFSTGLIRKNRSLLVYTSKLRFFLISPEEKFALLLGPVPQALRRQIAQIRTTFSSALGCMQNGVFFLRIAFISRFLCTFARKGIPFVAMVPKKAIDMYDR